MKKIKELIKLSNKFDILVFFLAVSLIVTGIISFCFKKISIVPEIIYGIFSIIFLINIIYNSYKISNIKLYKKDSIILTIFLIISISIYIYIIFTRKILYQYDTLIYYKSALSLVENFEISFFSGLKSIVYSICTNDYGYFLLSFIILPFSFTNKTENAFIICYCITLVIPTIIIYYLIMKKIMNMDNHKNNIGIITLFFLVFCPYLHIAAINGQPDIIGLIFAGLLILLTLDYDFSYKDLKREILIVILTICLILSRRWYMYWILGYVISYLIITYIYNKNDKEKLKKIIKNILNFIKYAIPILVVLLLPMWIKILKQDFSSYTSGWKENSLLTELLMQCYRLGIINVIILLFGIIYGLYNKKTRKVAIIMLLTYIIAFLGFEKIQNIWWHQSLILMPSYIIFVIILNLGICKIKNNLVKYAFIILICLIIILTFYGSITNDNNFFNNKIYSNLSIKPIKRNDLKKIEDVVNFIIDNCVENRDIAYINAACNMNCKYENHDNKDVESYSSLESYSSQVFSGYLYPNRLLEEIIPYDYAMDSIHGFPVKYIAEAKYIFVSNIDLELLTVKKGHIISSINKTLLTDNEVRKKFKFVREFNMTDNITFYAFERIEKFNKSEANYWKEIFLEQTKIFPENFGNRIDEYCIENNIDT